MKQTINQNDFIDAFRQAGRENNFNPKGLETLFDYFIAICCDLTQYENLAELRQDYEDVETFDDLESQTLVLYCGKYQDEESSFIIQNY